MSNRIIVGNLQRLAAFIKSNKTQVITALAIHKAVWQERTNWLVLDLGRELQGKVVCRAVTSGLSTRFCFHIVQDNKLVRHAYVACGYMFQEDVPPVVVQTLTRRVAPKHGQHLLHGEIPVHEMLLSKQHTPELQLA